MIDMLVEHPAEAIPVILKTVLSFQGDYLKKKEDILNHWGQE